MPQGALCLRAANTLHPESDAPLVWAVAPSAIGSAPFLKYASVSLRNLVALIGQLARIGEASAGHAERLA